MIDTHERIIEDNTYSVTQLPARRALKLKAKLLKIFGPMLGQLFISSSSGNDENASKKNFVDSIEIFTNQLDPNNFESLVIEILQGVRKNGVELTPATIDLEFAGNLETLYKVIFFVLEANYLGFFQWIGIGNLFEDSIPQAMEAPSKKTYIRR